MAAIELRGGKKIERGGEKADPSGAADGREKQRAGGNSGMKYGSEKIKNERRAEYDSGARGIGEVRNDFGMRNAEDQSGQSDDETGKRAGGAYVKESASGANGRTEKNESSQSADERWKRNEEGIARMDAVVTTSEEMAEFMNEQNAEEGDSKGEAWQESQWMAKEKSESVDEFVEG